MRRRSPDSMVVAILAVLCVCATVCCAAQAAPKYVYGQEKKNTLIMSIGENVDSLRSCLQPASALTGPAPSMNINGKHISEIVPSASAISIQPHAGCTAIAPSPREDIKGKSAE